VSLLALPLIALMAGAVAPALAQVVVPPGTARPFEGSPLPFVQPPQAPSVTMPGPAGPATPEAQVPSASVPVSSVTVEGVTAYDHAEIEKRNRDLIGPAVPLAKIEAARLALLKQYRDDGYVLSAVSVSIDANGALHLLVTEGRIASVKLSADIGPAGTLVLRFLQAVTQKTPIDEATLERALLLAQDVPGVTLHAVLQPVPGEPGALNLIAQVSRAPFSGLATVDNYASRSTGPIESLVVFDGNSFTSLGERTEVSLYHTWPNSQTFGQASTEMFVGDSGLRLRFYGGSGQTTPTGPLALEGYLGTTTVFGTGLTLPVIRSRAETLNLFANFDALESDISVLAGGTRGRASFDSIRVLRIGADYARSDILLGAERGAVNAATIRLSQGLPTMGASSDTSPTLPRTGEATNFSKLDFRLSRTQTLFTPYADTSVALMGVLAGQITNNTLPPAEEFYLGGLQYNRGYEAGSITGDSALTSTVELQLNTSFELSALYVPDPVPVQFYGFYDWGETWQHDPQSFKVRIASAGLGARVTATAYAQVDLLAAARLNRYPTGSGAGISALKAGTFLWRVLGRF
jgi:hemolysin activation/secretion protein